MQPFFFAVEVQTIVAIVAAVVGLIIYVVNQILESKPVQRQQRRRSDEEIDTFLREVETRRDTRRESRPQPTPRQQKQAAARQQQIAEREKKERERAEAQRTAKEPRSEKRKSLRETMEQSDRDQKAQRDKREEQFENRVQSDISTDDVKSRLGSHVKDTFDHQVGQLTVPDRTSAEASTVPSLTTDLIKLLSNPRTMQQAVLLNEIMQRPSDRWS